MKNEKLPWKDINLTSLRLKRLLYLGQHILCQVFLK